MSQGLCDNILKTISLLELMELESSGCIDDFFMNIVNGLPQYEWDIVSIFKIYNNHIENPPAGTPTCLCPMCMFMKWEYPAVYRKKIDTHKRYFYILWLMKTLSDKLIIGRVKDFLKTHSGLIIRKRMNEYYHFIRENNLNVPKEWKNILDQPEYYYKKLFDIPYMISSIGVPDEHYLFRKTIFFDDLIAGNPKASNGWAKESFDNIEQLIQSSSSSTNSVLGEIL